MKNIPIIYYHSVAPKQLNFWNRYWLTLELKYFEEHLKYFKKNNYKSLLLDEYLDIKHSNSTNKKYFLLTFDDGYLDNFIYVYPLLKKYGFKGTIFVNPEFVDEKSTPRKTLFDYWDNKASLRDIANWGFLNWEEMREMQESGTIDIQSHTMTHTKYFVSDKLVDFHHPGADSLYYIGNKFPERKPYYITDTEFEKLVFYGYPIFEQQSSVIARKVDINPSFNHSIIQSLEDIDWSKPYDFKSLYEKVRNIYDDYKKNNDIIKKIESEEEYEQRVYDELKNSKEILESNLDKKVDFLCWPHGDNNEFAHKTALELGYKATTLGKMPRNYLDETRYDRIGLGNVKNNIFLTNLKTRYKVESFRGKQPYKFAQNVYEYFRDSRQ